jgi:transposase
MASHGQRPRCNALLARPHTGRPPELTVKQKNLIPDLLSHGAEAYGFRGDVWTNARVAKAIEWEWSVRYHPSHVARLLKVLKWTPQLPIVRATTPQGWLFTMVRDESLTSVESVRFLKRLLTQLDRYLLVIWDGSPIYRGKEVKAYLADGATRHLHLEPLPPYAPDLNPDEGVWNHLKYVELRNMCCLNLGHLHHQLDLAVTHLRRKPYLIQSFFAGAGLDIRKV